MLKSRFYWAIGFGLLVAGCGSVRQDEPLKIAAASDLNFVLNAIAGQYPAKLSISYGSSGNFFTQISNGAPFDVFLSADLDYARKLARRPEDLFAYGVGRIVVWVPEGSALEPASALRSENLHKLAIANPQHAPYGRAAEAALRNMGVWDAVQPKLVLGENIVQTLQFAQSGAADAAIVALSLVAVPAAKGRYWEIPLQAYPRMEQGGVVLKNSAKARSFRDYLVSAQGRSVLKLYGFSMPGE